MSTRLPVKRVTPLWKGAGRDRRFDVHGLLGGYQGEGGKTMIPSWAAAKISFRLVPNQDPKTVSRQLQEFIRNHTPPGVRVEIIDLHGGRGVMVNPNSKFMKGAMQAVQEGFDAKPVLIREGGSIPIVAPNGRSHPSRCPTARLGIR